MVIILIKTCAQFTYPWIFFPEGFELATVEMSKIVIKYREAKGCLGKKIENLDWGAMLAQSLKLGSLGPILPY